MPMALPRGRAYARALLRAAAQRFRTAAAVEAAVRGTRESEQGELLGGPGGPGVLAGCGDLGG